MNIMSRGVVMRILKNPHRETAFSISNRISLDFTLFHKNKAISQKFIMSV